MNLLNIMLIENGGILKNVKTELEDLHMFKKCIITNDSC